MQRILGNVKNSIWNIDIHSIPVWKQKIIFIIRMIYVVIRDITDGQLTLRAMGLVYTTLLSMVPLIAVSFSVLKGFGIHNQVEPLLLNLLAPLGDKGIEVSTRIIEFVENMRVGVLGSVGLAFLLYTVIALIQKIERSFNYTWHIKHSRPFTQRFSDYLSVLLIGPVLVFSALGITATVSSSSVVQDISEIGQLGEIINLFGRLIPYLLIIAAFTFIYKFIPNTKVKIGSALTGAVVAGILWETTGWLFASFVAGSTNYTAIYSAFATLILFMIWLYLSWLILLVGASIAFYHQHPEYMSIHRQEMHISNRVKERVALQIMFMIGEHFYKHIPAWTMEKLSSNLNIPIDVIQLVVNNLEENEIIIKSDDDPPEYVPAQPLDTLQIKTILDVIRAADEGKYVNPDRIVPDKSVDMLFYDIDVALNEALNGKTLKDLIMSSDTVLK